MGILIDYNLNNSKQYRIAPNVILAHILVRNILSRTTKMTRPELFHSTLATYFKSNVDKLKLFPRRITCSFWIFNNLQTIICE